jgi:hypothetical protein
LTAGLNEAINNFGEPKRRDVKDVENGSCCERIGLVYTCSLLTPLQKMFCKYLLAVLLLPACGSGFHLKKPPVRALRNGLKAYVLSTKSAMPLDTPVQLLNTRRPIPGDLLLVFRHSLEVLLG